MLSVREVGRERVRLRVCWKARRSCFLFAVRSSEGLARMDLACFRSRWRVSSGSFGVGASVGVKGFAASEPPASVSVSSSLEVFWRSFRVARRSAASLGAPVARRTRSGSTWNISPGLSW